MLFGPVIIDHPLVDVKAIQTGRPQEEINYWINSEVYLNPRKARYK